MIKIITLGLGIVLGAWSLAGCAGKASCQQECNVDDDCDDGLGCFSGSSGKVCLPDDCGQCSDGSNVCRYFAEPAGDEMTCEFSSCM